MYDKPKHQNLPYNLKCKHLQKDLQIIRKNSQFFGKHMLMLDSFKNSCKKINKVGIKQPKN